MATTRWVYPELGILGTNQTLKMVEVDVPVPGLVGPQETGKWHLTSELGGTQGGSVTVVDRDGSQHRGLIIWGPKHHPVIDLLDFWRQRYPNFCS